MCMKRYPALKRSEIKQPKRKLSRGKQPNPLVRDKVTALPLARLVMPKEGILTQMVEDEQ